MTYRVLQDLVPLVPAFLNLDVLVILALVPRILQASSCLRTFTPALPPDWHILPPAPIHPHCPCYLLLTTQGSAHVTFLGLKCAPPPHPTPAPSHLEHIFVCCFFSWLFPCLFSYSYDQKGNLSKGRDLARLTHHFIPGSKNWGSLWAPNFYCQMSAHVPGIYCY